MTANTCTPAAGLNVPGHSGSTDQVYLANDGTHRPSALGTEYNCSHIENN